MDLLNCRLLEDNEATPLMQRAIRTAYKKLKMSGADQVDSEKCISLYNLKVERMISDVSDLEDSDKFQELELSCEVLTEIFAMYELAKKTKRVYDYTDMLSKFNDLLDRDAKAKAHVQTYYEYVIADEVQDFTPLMWSILHKLVDNGTPLTVIGDEDQNIYRFRGADIMNILHFSEIFDDAQVYMLAQNRRCRAAILDTARNVIETNTLRFNKKIYGTKDGGSVKYVPYNTQEGQLISVITDLKKLDADELHDTVICYRNKSDSILLADLLEEEDVPFHVISGSLPFSHELYRHVISIMNALEQPYDRYLSINLYKVLPCSRQALADVFGYNTQTRKFKSEDPKIHFAEYYYGKLLHMNGFVDAMETLFAISKDFENMTTKQIFDKIWRMLAMYFWYFKKEQNGDLEIDDIFEQRVKDFFNSDLTYEKFFAAYSRRLNLARKNSEMRSGVAVSTFHSLKGLE